MTATIARRHRNLPDLNELQARLSALPGNRGNQSRLALQTYLAVPRRIDDRQQLHKKTERTEAVDGRLGAKKPAPPHPRKQPSCVDVYANEQLERGTPLAAESRTQ